MRTSIALLGGISILFVGFQAIAEAAGNSKDVAYSAGNGSAAAYNMSEGVFHGLGTAGGSIVWMAVAAFILVACGLLVLAKPGGGR